MDFAWLEDFLELVECENFSRAAEKRGVSQPNFSRRIRALEEWVGATLVDRSTHNIRLTAAGERFRLAAEETLRRLQLGREETRAAAKAASETLRFAATHVLSLTFFAPWLRRLEAERPLNTTIELTADSMVACERLMIGGRVQFLLCHHHEAAATRLDGEFRSVHVGDDVLLPVKAPGAFPDARIADAPQLCFTAESGMGRILAAAWARAGRPAPAPPVFASHLASVLTAMARDGRGVAWTARSLVEDDLRNGVLERAGTVQDEVPIEIRLWRARARQSPAAEALWRRVTRTE
ncbi:MAG: LysR family transcriptional regulator [Hyphomonadaceae bacterium]|nr:LysR family transcriptional regulator [Hyphomonadaceae bacterium]GIK49456.1 MAG: LysR family transcriptional regulator [Alphaproteobacteria bacterium]